MNTTALYGVKYEVYGVTTIRSFILVIAATPIPIDVGGKVLAKHQTGQKNALISFAAKLK